jgi:murein DD-endopeptidase MepM/ murein hydrolase activator NlpD
MFYSGKTVLIDHGYGVFSSYSHLNEILVEQGEKIKQGQLIGKIGTTGRSTGPHLHLTLTWFGVRVDPEYVLKTHSCGN